MKRRNTASFLNDKITLDFVFIFICLSLLYTGYNTVKDLNWPFDLDQFRDIAQTQTILDSGYGKDPYYLNETTWYNPGLHFIFAAISILFKISVPQLIAQFGPFFIIFSPLAFYYMVKCIFGPWPAFFGSIAYLFLTNPYPAWATSLYSPFMFPIIISQAFFYLLITLLYKTIKSEQQPIKQYIFLGIAASLTFLVNTSSALIGGCIIVFFFIEKMRPELKNINSTNNILTPSLKRFLYFAIPTILISMVFLCFVIFHYRLEILNPMPTNWKWDLLTLEGLPLLLRTELFYLPNLIAIFGFIHFVKRKTDQVARKIIIYWLAIVLAYLAYYFLSILLKNFRLQLIVPVHHFFFYLKALSYVLFGYGVVVLAGMLGKLIKKRFTFAGKWWHLWGEKYLKLKPVFYFLLAVIGAVYVVTFYDHNEWLLQSKNTASERMADSSALDAYQWIRKNTKGNDVFLCSDRFSMKVVAPAARKVVATHPFFSNPYVNYEIRNNDREKMFECLESGKISIFSRLCKKYRVKYIIESTAIFRRTHPSLRKYLKRVFISGDVAIKKLVL